MLLLGPFDLRSCRSLSLLLLIIYRKVVDLGSKQQYHSDNMFSLKVRCLPALAFLPPTDVVQCFELLAEDDDLPSKLISYFEDSYVGPCRGRGARRRRLQPLFPVDMWNLHERAKNYLPPTNNPIEGFHNAIHSSVTSTHPNIWTLIDALKKEETLAQTKFTHLNRGDEPYKKKKYRTVNTRLKNLVDRYSDDDILTFLRGVAHNMKM